MGRLRSGKGRFVGWSRLPNSLVSLRQATVRKLTGQIPRQPWIPFAAAAAIAKVIRKDWRVWEVGAGFSTLWFAERVGRITSIESDKGWFDRLSAAISHERISNVDLRYEWHAERMSDFSELNDRSLDLLFIDGGPRDKCLSQGFAKVKSGGLIYLDNWENDGFWGDSERFVADHSTAIAETRLFVDYIPAQVGVYEGLLITKA